jgi:isoquinoline 1-oxidoreductase subunit beta
MGPKFFEHLTRQTAGLKPSRRQFLMGSGLIAGGFMVGFGPAGAAELPGFVMAPKAVAVAPYLRINKDNTVTVIAAQLDMGQGIYSGTATLVAEEMGADYAQMKVEGGAGDVLAYGLSALTPGRCCRARDAQGSSGSQMECAGRRYHDRQGHPAFRHQQRHLR